MTYTEEKSRSGDGTGGIILPFFYMVQKKRRGTGAGGKGGTPEFLHIYYEDAGDRDLSQKGKGIAMRKLELTLIDDENRPAYQVAQIAELLMKDLNFFCLLTERAEAFEELVEEAMEEHGLLMVLRSREEGQVPGNLTLDVGEWEKQLDIVSAVGYNTLTI